MNSSRPSIAHYLHCWNASDPVCQKVLALHHWLLEEGIESTIQVAKTQENFDQYNTDHQWIHLGIANPVSLSLIHVAPTQPLWPDALEKANAPILFQHAFTPALSWKSVDPFEATRQGHTFNLLKRNLHALRMIWADSAATQALLQMDGIQSQVFPWLMPFTAPSKSETADEKMQSMLTFWVKGPMSPLLRLEDLLRLQCLFRDVYQVPTQILFQHEGAYHAQYLERIHLYAQSMNQLHHIHFVQAQELWKYKRLNLIAVGTSEYVCAIDWLRQASQAEVVWTGLPRTHRWMGIQEIPSGTPLYSEHALFAFAHNVYKISTDPELQKMLRTQQMQFLIQQVEKRKAFCLHLLRSYL